LKKKKRQLRGLLWRKVSKKVNCSKCKKQLGFLKTKYELDDGSVLCSDCYDKRREKLIDEYVLNYLKKKEEIQNYIVGIARNKELNEKLHDINELKTHFLSLLTFSRSSIKRSLSSTEIDEISSTIDMCEKILDFCEDFSKIQKILSKKGIDVYDYELFDRFVNVSQANLDKLFKTTANSIYYRIKKLLEKKEITKEAVALNFMKHFKGIKFSGLVEIQKEIYVNMLCHIFDKLNLEYEPDEIEEFLRNAEEDLELTAFEKKLESGKQVFKLGDFKSLSGYGFEEYLQKLFKYMGYKVIRTPITGDQGADLIISKDNEKTVVQAKKHTHKISNTAVQEIVASKKYYKADKAMIVTNSSFTKGAIELALVNNVVLWDGSKLHSEVKNIEKESYKEEADLGDLIGSKIYRIDVPLSKKKIVDMQIECPLCEEKISFTIDKENPIDKIEGICPHCDAKYSLDIVGSWKCEYCGERFETKELAEEHEMKCKKREN